MTGPILNARGERCLKITKARRGHKADPRVCSFITSIKPNGRRRKVYARMDYGFLAEKAGMHLYRGISVMTPVALWLVEGADALYRLYVSYASDSRGVDGETALLFVYQTRPSWDNVPTRKGQN